MKISIRRLSTITLIWGLSLLGVATQARSQGYIFNELAGLHNSYGNGNGSEYGAWAIAQGDFNGDGRLDFAVADQFSPDCGLGKQQSCYEIQIYMAQSDGSYALTSTYMVPGDGSYPTGSSYSIAVADVNGDGKLDLVYSAIFNAPNGYPNYVVVQLGNGDGTFQSPIFSVTPAGNPVSLVLGDFNNDGKPDLALVDEATNIYVHLGNGDGTFQLGVSYTLPLPPGCWVRQVVAADLRKNGKLDLVAGAVNGGGAYVLLGNGDGTFGAPTKYSVGADAVAVADMNGDGILDLVVQSVTGVPQEGVSVLIGNGDGTFRPPILTAVSGNGSGIVTADFNGDGAQDVAMADGWTGIVILLGNNDGTFKSPIFAYGNIQAQYPGALIAGDYNLDGKVDLAAVGYVETGEPFTILTNNGDGTFGVGGDLDAGQFPQAVATGDFNGDGILDLAVTNYNGVAVYLGKGNGAFQAPQTYSVGTAGGGNIVVADFNHDGKLDLAVVNPGSSGVSVLLGVGDGSFLAPVTYQTGSTPDAIAVGDFNKDGKLDLVVTDSGDSNVAVLLGNGDGTFQAPIFSSTGAGTSANNSVAVADFNRDGNPDIVVGSENAPAYGGSIDVLFGNGDGTFQSPTDLPFPYGTQVYSVGAADLRGNGIADVVVSSIGNNPGMLVYLGNGDGTFSAPIKNYGSGRSIAFGDFNGDGKLDVAFAGLNSFAAIALGNGDGTFQAEMQYAVPRAANNIYASSLAIGDFNGDGSPDMAALSCCWFGDGFLTIFLSNPVVAFSSSNLSFGNINVGSDSSAMNFTVTNQSPTKMTVSSIAVTGANSADFTQTNDCGSSLTGGASCNVSVTFSPTYPGTRTAAVTLTSSSAGSPQSVILSGVGTGAPVASVSPSSLTFGNQDVGTTSPPQTVTLSNTGTAPLTVSSIVASGDFAETNNCGSSVAAGASCTISVTFTPTVTGTRNGTLTITDNNNGVNGSQQTVSLTGTGINPGGSVSPTSLSFGNQVIHTASAPKKVTLTSTGTTPLSFVGITFAGANAGDFSQTNNCPGTLNVGAKCTINVTFTPSILGAESATLDVNDNAANSPQTVALSGTGVAPVTLLPTAANFGNVAEATPSAAKNFTLTNNQNVTLNISSITTNNPDYTQTNTCGSSLAAKGHCTISVTFTPSIIGTDNGTLSVADNASNSPETAALTGAGIVPATLTPTTLAFGNEPQAVPSLAKNLTLTNNANVALNISSITTNNPDYTQSNTCGTSLVAKAHCTITVTFTPSIIGTDNATLSVADSAMNSPQTVSLTGTGIAQATVSPASLTFAAQKVGTTSAAKNVTLTNNLTTSLTFSGVTLSGANTGDFASPSNTCGGSVPAKGHCSISVTFTPTATGTRTATMNVNDSANNSPQTVSLTGTGK